MSNQGQSQGRAAKENTMLARMRALVSARRIDGKRGVLAAVLAAIALALTAGGAYLASLGGSFYYLIAGFAVAGSAWLILRGDARGRWLYAAMLLGTLIWACGERGLEPWGLQSRLFAPAVLGAWVFWPALRRWPRSLAAAGALTLAASIWLIAGGADPVEKPSIATGPVASGRGDWRHYGNDLGGTRFSPVAQITPDNVGQLTEAWKIQIGEDGGGGFEGTPLFVGDTLYLCSPTSVIVALDPDTGKRRWTYNPQAEIPAAAAHCRGVAYYAVPNAKGVCAERILMTTVDARLIAVDVRDGKPCPDFGVNGVVDLRSGLGPFYKDRWHTTSAPEVIRGTIVFNAFVLDNQSIDEPSGVIRGYDAVSGKLAWAWDMDRPDRKGEPPAGENYSLGTANSWGPISGDEALGLVYLPMGNSTPDYFGGHRSPASEKYSSGVVALDASTGQMRWSYQITHHDVWDYDVAAQPTLVDFAIGGRMVPALIQQNKRGQTFVLDRRTGTPLTKVEEKPTPQAGAAGERLSPTQPFSTDMPVFDDRVLAERTMWGLTPLDQLWCRIAFRNKRWDGPMTPPGLTPNLVYPGYSGGVNWGGVAVDPERRLMVVNWMQVANSVQLIPRAVADAAALELSGVRGLEKPMPQAGTPYAATSRPFWSPLQIPCTEPPFGSIAVVDLDTRKIVWQKPLGNTADSGPFNLRLNIPLPMGVPNMGGAVTTRAGLIFIAATQEQAIRAFDIRDGRKLWSARLPAGGQATPMTFVSPRTGKQYIVIAAGGNFGLATKKGDYVVAYALP